MDAGGARRTSGAHRAVTHDGRHMVELMEVRIEEGEGDQARVLIRQVGDWLLGRNENPSGDLVALPGFGGEILDRGRPVPSAGPFVP